MYRKILDCLHPDRGMSDAALAEAFNAFQKCELVLCNEKEMPTGVPPLPETVADLLARKHKLDEERKAKRAARTDEAGR
jgi:hypothetical protein